MNWKTKYCRICGQKMMPTNSFRYDEDTGDKISRLYNCPNPRHYGIWVGRVPERPEPSEGDEA